MISFLKKIFITPQNKFYEPKLFIFTGAGISADSGLATYRDNQDKTSLWNEYDSKKFSNYQTWYQNKTDVFEFWNARKNEMNLAQPNIAHLGIVALQEKYKDRVFIATQNIDMLFERANAKNVLHVHGNIYNMECKKCSHKWYIGEDFFDIKMLCPQCQSDKVKPDIVLFGENAPKYKVLYDVFNFRQIHPQDIILCIGTSFKVCTLDNIIGYDQYQPGFKILANYTSASHIPESRFDNVFYGKVIDNWDSINNIILKKMLLQKL